MFFFKKQKREPKDFEEILSQFKNLEKNFEEISQELENLKKESKFSVQKLGIVRYNPFSEVGSDQSFSIALLDGNNNGVVITSLYSREGNRVYGKPIKNGSSVYSLSKEEKQAIEQAKSPEGPRPQFEGGAYGAGKNETKNKRKSNPEGPRSRFEGGAYGAGNPPTGSGGFGPH